MSGPVFDSVDWPSLRTVQARRPKMFQLWLTKQASKFCGSRVQMARMHGHEGEDDACPNCGNPGERASHLNVCVDEGRSKLFFEMVDRLEEWMWSTATDPELACWIPMYLRARNSSSFRNLRYLPSRLSRLATTQDGIGWLHFLEGKVSSEIRNIQALFLAQSNTRVTIDSWMSKFIGHFLDISHSQWIYRNITLHHHSRGTLQLRRRKEVLAEIERQLQLPASEIPETSRFLLEIPRDELDLCHPTEQSYWLLAIQAARKAGRRVVSRFRRKRSPSAIVKAAVGSADRSMQQPDKKARLTYFEAAVVGPTEVLGKREADQSWATTAYDDPSSKRRKPD